MPGDAKTWRLTTPVGESPTSVRQASGKWITVEPGTSMDLRFTDEQAAGLVRWLGPELVKEVKAGADKAEPKPKVPSKPKAQDGDSS